MVGINLQGGLVGGIWSPGVKVLANLNALVFCYWFYLTSHSSQTLAAQRDTQGFGIGDGGLLPESGESRECRDYYMPTPVTPEEFGLRVRTSGMVIFPRPTQRRSQNTMGNWRTLKEFLGMKTQRIRLGTNTSSMVYTVLFH